MEQLNENEVADKIISLKKRMRDEIVILGHHYQREEIIEHCDFVGDSYYLAKVSSQNKNAKFIIFCGVRFMAETAAILCNEDQKVIHPDKDAGCPLADMANLQDVEEAWDEMSSLMDMSEVMPVTYINSDAQLKAFCGKNGGLVCTSSNAKRAMEYAFKRRQKLFFFPDQHLGRNTAFGMGIEEKRILLWNPALDFGGNEKDDFREAKVILWNGFCHVHTHFSLEHVSRVRESYPDAKIIVHPECKAQVVRASDEAGSTAFIVDYVERAPKGSVIAVGTEINLVRRLSKNNPDKKIIELSRSLCPNMYRINLPKLLFAIENVNEMEPVRIGEDIRINSTKALKRMLEV